MKAFGLYDPSDERDNCGVGFIAAINGQPSRWVTEAALEALSHIWHRGAVDADGMTGDGAGIMLQLPQEFFKDQVVNTGHKRPVHDIGVGQIFLPRTDLAAQENVRSIIETEISKAGYEIYGWRQVPVDIDVIGEKARSSRPQFEQIMINPTARGEDNFERDLYLIRRRIENEALAASISDFYICSFSSRSVVYKGLFLAEQTAQFYPDLNDPRFCSNFAIFHQRYSTNTFPSWKLAQPFRHLAHNGEINTLKGNLNWMKIHEANMIHPVFGEKISNIKPIIPEGASDSAALDNVFELLCRAGRSAPMAKTLLIPESFQSDETISTAHHALYMYANSVMEPWDGPAAIAASDSRWVIGGLDRNGLRPFRYSITKDGFVIAGSEAGMARIAEENILEKGRLGPGQMIAIDLQGGMVYKDQDIKDKLAARHPFTEWTKDTQWAEDLVSQSKQQPKASIARKHLLQLQKTCGQTMEDMDLILRPMAEEGKEAIGSMGDDTPLAVLSDHYHGLHHFFRQNFAQVTNPPIDPLRERRVMSLITRIGNLGNILEESQEQCRLLSFKTPIITNAELHALEDHLGDKTARIDTTFPKSAGKHGLKKALRRIQKEAENILKKGRCHLILTDEALNAERLAIPSILAIGAVQKHLIETGLRHLTSLNVRSAECLDVHHFAVMIGLGATTINPWLSEAALLDGIERNVFKGVNADQALGNYKKAISDGLLKIMSKMGISVINSYRGGAHFEAIGLSRALIAEYLPGITSRISGIGLSGIQQKIIEQHARAFDDIDCGTLPIGGFYRIRDQGETHIWESKLIHLLQRATTDNSYDTYKKYVSFYNKQAPMQIRDLLRYKSDQKSIEIEDVESVADIRKRFITPGMSLGALSPEAHGALNVAMNRIGNRSNSGEGGEDTERYTLDQNGDDWNSAIKQISSGRFGVTAEYLNQCREIEIKIAQGAKPGEGGQLPGFKVTEMIAKFRHATPGVMLISPPPHHDIYSIEDLAQLIYDLKQINPEARVCVKLVARSGIGAVAAGVAKAHADIIQISGHVGGTGASPQSSIKHAGIPWEMGLAEVRQVLGINDLRSRVTLRTDGGLRSGRDIVIAAMLGAEEFGIGTASLIAMGCLMVRQCHSNTCPVGVCTQDEKLRKYFTGSPDKVINLFTFIAQDVREILASLGFKSLDEIVGRADLLYQLSRGGGHLDDLDLNSMLVQATATSSGQTTRQKQRNPVPDSLDMAIINDIKSFFEHPKNTELSYAVHNTDRAIGTRLSSAITKHFSMHTLPPDQITITLKGSAGQSLGGFAVQGIKLVVSGEANDYVGKGLSGGTIVVKPPQSASYASRAHMNTIIGNTVLYGATAGKLFAAGEAGERFAVRNSGAIAVVEGCGANGCEYMTGGAVVILGAIGTNFAAGMTGGRAYIYDPEGKCKTMLNQDYAVLSSILPEDEALSAYIQEHIHETRSALAQYIHDHWPQESRHFYLIKPKTEEQ